MHLSRFDVDHFLQNSWQKQPLLIRNTWDRWENPLAPDDLAGLACAEDVESRIVMQSGKGMKAEHGPFAEHRFAKLGKNPWTLLVQAVDHYVPAVAALIAPFRFIPNWRIDDVMVSYASDGGGVGPHFDHYDVFLVQGLGRRRWQIGGMCDDSTPLLPHDDLRLLAQFEPQEEWLLEPGDMLYVPPGVAHNGIAVGDDCMTYSIGFRAPARSELISGWCDDLVVAMHDDDRYADPALPRQDNPGEITAAALDRLHAMVLEKLQDRAAFARWFGGYASTPKYPDMDFAPEQTVTSQSLRAHNAAGAKLCRNPASHFSFIRQSKQAVQLFVDGICFECTEERVALAERLCAHNRLEIDLTQPESDAALSLLADLFNQGSIFFCDAD